MKRVAVLWPLAAAVVVIGVGAVLAVRLTRQAPPEQIAVAEAVKDRVRGVVPYPSSAKFSDVAFFDQSKTGCGKVSVRNEAGVYSDKFFIEYRSGGGVRFSGESPPNDFLEEVRVNCPSPALQKLAQDLVARGSSKFSPASGARPAVGRAHLPENEPSHGWFA
jgi:hypothetical protein